MKQFKIRPAMCGQIMTNPRSKSETLSKTCQTYLQEWYKEQIYGVRNEIENKYLTKGTEMEDESISVYASFKDFPFVIKNEKTYSSDYMVGTPDLIFDDMVTDIKTSWNCFTFPLFETEIPDKSYYWQLQCYMELTGRDKAELAYVLVNTPIELQYSKLDQVDYEQFDFKHRVKVFSIERNEEDIEAIKERVKLCREYLKSIEL